MESFPWEVLAKGLAEQQQGQKGPARVSRPWRCDGPEGDSEAPGRVVLPKETVCHIGAEPGRKKRRFGTCVEEVCPEETVRQRSVSGCKRTVKLRQVVVYSVAVLERLSKTCGLPNAKQVHMVAEYFLSAVQ